MPVVPWSCPSTRQNLRSPSRGRSKVTSLLPLASLRLLYWLPFFLPWHQTGHAVKEEEKFWSVHGGREEGAEQVSFERGGRSRVREAAGCQTKITTAKGTLHFRTSFYLYRLSFISASKWLMFPLLKEKGVWKFQTRDNPQSLSSAVTHIKNVSEH